MFRCQVSVLCFCPTPASGSQLSAKVLSVERMNILIIVTAMEWGMQTLRILALDTKIKFCK